MLVVTDGEAEHRLYSRVCQTVDEAHHLIGHSRGKHYIGPNDVRDNSRMDMNELLNGMGTDFSPAQN
jgi:hypothetical protein